MTIKNELDDMLSPNNARNKQRKLGSNVSGKREASYEKEKNERMNRNLTREDDQNRCRKPERPWLLTHLARGRKGVGAYYRHFDATLLSWPRLSDYRGLSIIVR
jgi:hypothetical protein